MDMDGIPESEAVQPELEHETCQRRRGRDVLVAIDHGPQSRAAFEWALTHFLRLADTLHLVHVLPKPEAEYEQHITKSNDDEGIWQASQLLMEQLCKEAYEVAMVQTKVHFLDGDVGKAICAEASRLQAPAVIMGNHGHGLVRSVVMGSVTEYCSRHCSSPIVIVPYHGVHALFGDEHDELGSPKPKAQSPKPAT